MTKEMKIVFAPGCFDTFEGTQEELDQLMKDITDKFTNMTPEEMKAESSPLDLDELSEEELAALSRALFTKDECDEMGVPNPEKRNLQ
jgi:hypothetical protein